jgi:hypothetical protein
MPAVIDTPERLEYVETHNLTIKRPLAQPQRPSFWRTLMPGIIAYLTPTLRQQRVPLCHNAFISCETSVDRVVRLYPSLAPYALSVL